jgi:hypothetical protein
MNRSQFIGSVVKRAGRLSRGDPRLYPAKVEYGRWQVDHAFVLSLDGVRQVLTKGANKD